MTNRLFWLVAVCCPTLACADTATSQFAVSLELKSPQTCINQALSEQAGGLVQVVCRSGSFVRIDPDPSKPFAGTNGAAFRYVFGPAAAVPEDSSAAATGLQVDAGPYGDSGTVTGLRVYSAPVDDGPLGILITY